MDILQASQFRYFLLKISPNLGIDGILSQYFPIIVKKPAFVVNDLVWKISDSAQDFRI